MVFVADKIRFKQSTSIIQQSNQYIIKPQAYPPINLLSSSLLLYQWLIGNPNSLIPTAGWAPTKHPPGSVPSKRRAAAGRSASCASAAAPAQRRRTRPRWRASEGGIAMWRWGVDMFSWKNCLVVGCGWFGIIVLIVHVVLVWWVCYVFSHLCAFVVFALCFFWNLFKLLVKLYW